MRCPNLEISAVPISQPPCGKLPIPNSCRDQKKVTLINLKIKKMKKEDREQAEAVISRIIDRVIDFYGDDYRGMLDTEFMRTIMRTTIIFTADEILKFSDKNE